MSTICSQLFTQTALKLYWRMFTGVGEDLPFGVPPVAGQQYLHVPNQLDMLPTYRISMNSVHTRHQVTNRRLQQAAVQVQGNRCGKTFFTSTRLYRCAAYASCSTGNKGLLVAQALPVSREACTSTCPSSWPFVFIGHRRLLLASGFA